MSRAFSFVPSLVLLPYSSAEVSVSSRLSKALHLEAWPKLHVLQTARDSGNRGREIACLKAESGK